MDLLKNKPSAEQIEQIILSHSNQSNSESLQLVTYLVNYTIPETFLILPKTTQDAIIKTLQSIVGIGNLTSKLKLVTLDLTGLYLDILLKVFDQKLVIRLSQNASPPVVNEIDKLIFKGKTYATVNEVSYATGNHATSMIHSNSIAPFNAYNTYLTNQVLELYHHQVDLKIVNRFLNSLVSIDAGSFVTLFDSIFTEENLPFFISSFKVMSRLERKKIIQLLIKYLNKKDLQVVVYFNLIQFISESIESSTVEHIIRCLNYDLNLVFCLLISFSASSTKIVLQLMSSWSDELLMKSESIIVQESRTHFLVNLLTYCNLEFVSTLMKKPVFLDAISNRLQSMSTSSKSLGTLLANHVCKITKKDLIFKDDDTYEYLVKKKLEVVWLDLKTCWGALNLVEPLKALTIQDSQVTKMTGSNVDSIDSDDDTDDDDPTIVKQDKLTKPIYIKQLLEYLTENEKDANAYEKKRLALLNGSTLIRQKFHQEILFYAEDLLTNLVALSTENKKQNESKLEMMISILVKIPDSVTHLYKLLLTGDYSLQQRMVILTSASLSIRELRGYKDGLVKFEEKDFASSKLPTNLHKFYLELPLSSIQNTMMDKIKTSQGQVLRKSSKLTKEVISLKPIVEGFYKNIVNKKYFFPLINLWYESGENIDIGHYTPIFLAQYISTLNLILHCAYPSAANLRDMIQEYLLVTTSILKLSTLDHLQVIESVITGVMIVCDISIVQDSFVEPLQFVQNWLVQNWEGIIDEKLKSLCAGLLLRLNDLESNLFQSL